MLKMRYKPKGRNIELLVKYILLKFSRPVRRGEEFYLLTTISCRKYVFRSYFLLWFLLSKLLIVPPTTIQL